MIKGDIAKSLAMAICTSEQHYILVPKTTTQGHLPSNPLDARFLSILVSLFISVESNRMALGASAGEVVHFLHSLVSICGHGMAWYILICMDGLYDQEEGISKRGTKGLDV